MSEVFDGVEPRWFLQDIEQLRGAEHPVALCAADFFDDSLLSTYSTRRRKNWWGR